MEWLLVVAGALPLLLSACDSQRAESTSSSPPATPPATTTNVPPAGTQTPGTTTVTNAGTLPAVDPANLCVTSGKIERAGSAVACRSGGTRAVFANTEGSAVEVSFTYRGPTPDDVPLGNGELRRQMVLKLRAQDTCNVVYVSWHIAPTAGIFVSVKSNPGQSTHRECLDRGYINLKPSWQKPVSLVKEGERHTFGARIEGETLKVTVDGSPAWEGTLPREAFAFDGPVGIRSDNGVFEVEVRARASAKPTGCQPRD